MARIAGVDLPREKRVEIGLTYIYGIGRPTANKILAETGIDPDIRVKDLTEAQVSLIRDYIEKNLHVEGDLKREVGLNIKRLMEIGCYRGIRHRKGLPVRGQSTKQNARTNVPSAARRKANKGGVQLWQVRRSRRERISSAWSVVKPTSMRRSTTPSSPSPI